MKIINFDFPIKSLISFAKLLESFKTLEKDEDIYIAKYASKMISLINSNPKLLNGLEDIEEVKSFQKEIKLITRSLFPESLLTNEIKGITAPFHFDTFLNSKRLQDILNNAPKGFKFKLKAYEEELFYKMGCNAIMAMHYGYSVPASDPMIIPIENTNSGQTRYYRAAINVDLCDLKPTSTAVDITEADFRKLTRNFDDINLWKSYFPPNSWELKGLGMLNLMDVTTDQAILDINQNLLFRDQNTFEKISENLKSFLGLHDISIGFLGYENGELNYQSTDRGFQSIILHKSHGLGCLPFLRETYHEKLIKNKKHLTLYDIDNLASESRFIECLKSAGYKSYLIQPILSGNETLGFIELGSKNPFELNEFIAQKLLDVLPALSTSISRFKNEYNNRLEALLQEKCTSIHDSVKWKFIDEAKSYLAKLDNGESPIFKEIRLDHVYPLYGQLDIKDSSLKRNTALTLDLIKQLTMVENILDKAFQETKLPTIEELKSSTLLYIEEITNGIIVSSEYSISSFLNNEVNPLFKLLKEMKLNIVNDITFYESLLDNNEGLLYEERRNWDESVHLCNQKLSQSMSLKQIDAQRIFPHYFDRYNTDGLEYNIYIGDSTSKNQKFNPIHLENLRLWQLTTMCEMERDFRKSKSEFKTPIEIASLILLFNSSFNVRFREDEKRFDVVGAYNARYEIIKKRIDKAKIKGTKERITKPEHITIIYTSLEDRDLYTKHIYFLEDKGLLVKDSSKDFELEELQGVTGLRALRVKVNYV